VLTHVLREWKLESLGDPALLLVSELVTNAVQAAESRACRDHPDRHSITLTVQLNDDRLVMRIWDANPTLPVLRESDVTGSRGRGLLLVDLLADAWGHHAVNGGKVVWCAVAAPVSADSRRANGPVEIGTASARD